MTNKQIKKLFKEMKPLLKGTIVSHKEYGIGVIDDPDATELHTHYGFDRYWVNYGDYKVLVYIGNLTPVED